MKTEYHEVGEAFEFNGRKYRAEPGVLCADCAFGGCRNLICSRRNRKDDESVVFVEIGMTVYLKQQLDTLKDVMRTYSGKTIDNIVMQMEARIKEMEKGGTK